MHSRLQLLIKEYSLTSARFAEILGIQPSAVSHLISGRNKPGFDIISKILARFPEVNPRWLILGEEPLYLTSTNRREPISDNSLLPGLYTSRPEAESKESPKAPEGMGEDFNNADKGYGTSPLTGVNAVTAEQILNTRASYAINSDRGTVVGPGIDKIIIFYSDGTFESFTSK